MYHRIIDLVSISSESFHRLILTFSFLIALGLFRLIVELIGRFVLRGQHERMRFWLWQVISMISAVVLVLGIVSIWFEDPRRLTTAVGLVTAGVAFALQKVITAFAGYFVILRGRNFTIGDRIAMGGVRGDVMALGFMQTTIMEMGQSPPEQEDAPSVWIKSRQYTGRIVTVTNDKIFEQPVYNYTREFPFIWEEMTLPIAYKDNYKRAEEILLEVAERHTQKMIELAGEALVEMKEHYYMHPSVMKPKVYYRLTDNWIELAVRFITTTPGTRRMKDAMSREILAALEAANIGVASSTYDIVGFPPVRLQLERKPK
ncbi:MAG TPA: mechanosensitive ion channel domain-containing protein [Blastocatellia bacterium]|nr:mechanosensitive ion channel domain-containing protein [Blastocatellia bacterium]